MRKYHLLVTAVASCIFLVSCTENTNISINGSQANPGCNSELLSTSTTGLPLLEEWMGGPITVDGRVPPPDSAHFDLKQRDDNGNIKFTTQGALDDFCKFQRWSFRTFLWLTSPAGSEHGVVANDGPFPIRVFNSQAFYSVGNLVNNERALIPQMGASPLKVGVRDSKSGPNGLPTLKAKNGLFYELAPTRPGSGTLPVVMSGGKVVEVDRVARSSAGTVLLNKAGQPIRDPRPIFVRKFHGSSVVQEIRVQGEFVGLASTGTIIEFTPGQAIFSHVLMARNQSLVYYNIAVNNVYANFRKMVHINGSTSTPFPTTSAELQTIKDFAAQNTQSNMVDSQALAVEIKTAWVERALLLYPDEYITIEAQVPDYDKTTNPNKWIKKPNLRSTTLALIGMHVVGSAAGHPKMIWATFEHKRNTPNASYTIESGSGVVNDDTSNGLYLFSSISDDPSMLNKPTMALDSVGDIVPLDANGNIVSTAVPGFSFRAASLKRLMPWGSADAIDPAPIFNTGNSRIINENMISINAIFQGAYPGGGLAIGDVRRNYKLIGTTWFFRDVGQPTVSLQMPPSLPLVPMAGIDNWQKLGNFVPTYAMTGTHIGNNQLSNTTMESFFQHSTFQRDQNNCLNCHVVNQGAPSTTVSRIFWHIQPLP